MIETGTILLVEDDKFTARMIELQFEKNGFLVKHAVDGEAALALLQESPFDIVLSDMIMPKVTGLELLKRIRLNYDRVSLPFIMLTASDHGAKVKEAIRLGANDFFTKDEDFSVLLTRVTLQIALKRATQSAALAETRAMNGIRSSPDGFWEWRLEKGAAHFSSAWKANLGFGSDELPPAIETWFERIHPDDSAAFHQALRAHHARQTSWLESDHRLLGKDGRYQWAHVFGVALFKAGKPVRMFGSMCTVQDPRSLGPMWQSVGETLNHLEQGLQKLKRSGSVDRDSQTAEAMLNAVQACLGLVRETLPARAEQGRQHAEDEATL